MVERNKGVEFDVSWLDGVDINSSEVDAYAAEICATPVTNTQDWLLKALTLTDLTSLGSNDTPDMIERLCSKAVSPLPSSTLSKVGVERVSTAAVCVYPVMVETALNTLTNLQQPHFNIASVAAGFPSGQYPLHTRVAEVQYAVVSGATEIDIVINRTKVLTGDWKGLYDEVSALKAACGKSAHMKTILATGELGSLSNVYKASMVAMMAGSDFIKTSTGKETVNATLPVGITMIKAIKQYHNKTGYKVGLKPAGGIKKSGDAFNWMTLMEKELGAEYLTPHLFRIGASSLLADIENQLSQL